MRVVVGQRIRIAEQLVHLVGRLDDALGETFVEHGGAFLGFVELVVQLRHQLVVALAGQQALLLGAGEQVDRLLVLLALDVDRRQLRRSA